MAAPPPEVDLSKQFDKEKNDPAMVAYLKSLGIDPDYVPPKDDPRRVVISEFAIIFKVITIILIVFDVSFFFRIPIRTTILACSSSSHKRISMRQKNIPSL